MKQFHQNKMKKNETYGEFELDIHPFHVIFGLLLFCTVYISQKHQLLSAKQIGFHFA